MDNPQEAPTGQGSSTPGAGHTVVGAHTEEARTRPVPVRRFHNAAPQRTTRKPNPARALAGARLLSGRLAAGEHDPNPPEQNFVRNIHVHNCRGIVLCRGSVGALLSA